MNDFSKTIAAISTPRGKGGIAVIRLSGPDAIAAAGRMFRPKNGKPLADCAPRTAVFGTICDADDEPCDEGIVTVFRGPHSFTGEDVAEIACHGGPAVTEAVCLSAIAHGAVAAGPGEFTRRAFVQAKSTCLSSLWKAHILAHFYWRQSKAHESPVQAMAST